MWHGHLCPPFPDSTHLILQSACLLESRCWCVLMESNWAIPSVFSEQSSHSDFVLASCRIFTGSSLAFFRLTTLQPYWAAPKVCNAYIWNIRAYPNTVFGFASTPSAYVLYKWWGVAVKLQCLKEVSTGHGYVTERQFLIQRSTFTSFFKQDSWRQDKDWNLTGMTTAWGERTKTMRISSSGT